LKRLPVQSEWRFDMVSVYSVYYDRRTSPPPRSKSFRNASLAA
jgi:hypothetical protein